MDIKESSDISNVISYDYFKADYNKCKLEINKVNWEVLHSLNVNAAWCFFRNKILSTVKDNVPLKRIKRKEKNLWFTKAVKRAINKKNKAFKSFKNKRSN